MHPCRTASVAAAVRAAVHLFASSLIDTGIVRGVTSAAESQFLDGYQGDVATVHLPESMPSWLWNGVRYSRHPTILLVYDHVGAGGTIREDRAAGTAKEDEDDESGLAQRKRGMSLEMARGGSEANRGEGRGGLSGRGMEEHARGGPLPQLPGLRGEEEEEEDDADEDPLDARAMASSKTGLGPVREAVQQREAAEQISRTISALALEGLELANPSRNFL